MTYRVGTHQPRNLYRGDQYIGVCFDPADTALIVDAMEGHPPAVVDLSDLALRFAATKVRAARPGVEPQTALAVVQALVAMGWRPPSARTISPRSAQEGPVGGSGRPEGSQALSAGDQAPIVVTRDELTAHIDDPVCTCARCHPEWHTGIRCNCPYCRSLRHGPHT